MATLDILEAEQAAQVREKLTIQRQALGFYLYLADEAINSADILKRMWLARKRETCESKALNVGWHATRLDSHELVKTVRDRGGLLHLGSVRIEHRPDAALLDDEYVAAQKTTRGHATLEILAVCVFVTFVLGWFGPAIDRRAYSDYGYTPEQVGEYARLDAEARHRCSTDPGDNTAWIQTADGTIICTDKRGRRPRSIVTTAVKVQR